MAPKNDSAADGVMHEVEERLRKEVGALSCMERALESADLHDATHKRTSPACLLCSWSMQLMWSGALTAAAVCRVS